MSLKRGYFCGFCQKEGTAETVINCERCKSAIYCGADSECKEKDWDNHKTLCGKVTYLQMLIPRIEENFYNFNLTDDLRLSGPKVPANLEAARKNLEFVSKNIKKMLSIDIAKPAYARPGSQLGHQNIFETRVGEFGALNNRRITDPCHNNPNRMWPRDYLVRRIRLAENKLEIALKHQNRQILVSVLRDLLAQIRLDFGDFCMAVPMAGFMFLYLGRYNDAYDFIKFWLLRIEDQDHYGAWEKWYPLPEGAYLNEKNSDRFEDVFSVFDLKDINLKTLLVLVGIKIKVVLDLRNLEAFDDELRKSKCKSAKNLLLNENQHILDSIRENIIGKANLKESETALFLKNQVGQLMQLLWEIERQNPTMIPALFNPEPLLDKEVPHTIWPGGPSQVCEILRYTWKYFELLPGARGILQDFIRIKNPKHGYCTKFENEIYETTKLCTGFDRTYVLPGFDRGPNTSSLHRFKEFKKGTDSLIVRSPLEELRKEKFKQLLRR